MVAFLPSSHDYKFHFLRWVWNRSSPYIRKINKKLFVRKEMSQHIFYSVNVMEKKNILHMLSFRQLLGK